MTIIQPKFHKIVISSQNETILAQLTRQAPIEQCSNQQIARTSVRKRDSQRFFVTLRRRRMQAFFDRLKSLNLPINPRFRRFLRFKELVKSKTITIPFRDCRDFLEIQNRLSIHDTIGFKVNFCFKTPINCNFNEFLQQKYNDPA